MFFFKASQRPGNQSSLTSLPPLSVRLNVVTDVYFAKNWNTPETSKTPDIFDVPSPYSFIVRFHVVINVFTGNSMEENRRSAHKSEPVSITVIVTVSVFTDEFNERTSVRSSRILDKAAL